MATTQQRLDVIKRLEAELAYLRRMAATVTPWPNEYVNKASWIEMDLRLLRQLTPVSKAEDTAHD